MKNMASRAVFSVRLSDETRAKINYLSRTTHRTPSSIASQILEEEVGKKARKILAIEEAKEDIKSGVFHSGEQIFEWLDSWGTENELPSPAPDIFT